jgi:Glycosyltransferase Family 4
MRPISVLFTNNALGPRGGTETYVRDVALALLRRGHRPAAFSLVHGDVAAELRRATIPVVDDVTRLGEAPDVIHGHHHLETLIAALAFPETPVVNFCHGWVPWEEMPLHHPAVRRYVAVDEVCVDRLVREEGLSPERIELLLNFVDLDRFRPRPPLPARPARALIMSHAATAGGYARSIRAACEAAGIAVDIVGAAAGNSTDAPEMLLPEYDLVFAKGRTALEALAVGCATVLADAAGAGPLVTPDNYDSLRGRNFGIRELTRRHDVAWYRAQIAPYCAQMAAQVSERVRAEAGMDPAIARLLDIYSAAIAAPPGPGDTSRAAAIHCSRIALPLKQAYGLSDRIRMVAGELEQARADVDVQARAAERQAAASHALQKRVDWLLADSSRREQEIREAERQIASTGDQVRALQSQVAAFQALPTLRLRDAVLRAPVAGPFLQKVARRLARRLRPDLDRPDRSQA